MAEPTALRDAERTFVSRLREQIPGLGDVMAVAKRLNGLLRRDSQESLGAILNDAATTLLKGFAAKLGRDVAAVQAALDLPWTTSPVEGQINRLKMLKRTMYGRAGFQLLRARVLQAARTPAACKMQKNPKFIVIANWSRLKERRAIATRYDKTAASYAAGVAIAASLDWINSLLR